MTPDPLHALARETAEKIAGEFFGVDQVNTAKLIEAALLHAQQVQREELEAAKTEAAKYLSPNNENVKCGYLVAMIRDLAQIKVTAQGNAEDAMRLLKGRDEQIGMLRLEVKAAAAGAPAHGSMRTMLLDWYERLATLRSQETPK